MSATVEDEHFTSPQNFSSGDYLSIYATDDNNVVILIQSTPESADTQKADMPDEEMVDTMGDDITEEMECKNGNIFDDSGSSFGCHTLHAMDMG